MEDSAGVVEYKRYSGMSHWLLVVLPPTICCILGCVFVFVGPFNPVVNYLMFGLFWAVIWPIRLIIRDALKYATLQFRSREFSWWSCVRYGIRREIHTWRSEPKQMTQSRAFIMLITTLFWPATIWLATIFQSQFDHG